MFLAAACALLCNLVYHLAVSVSSGRAGFLSTFKDFISRAQAGTVLALGRA
jgi:hypothetical protein